MILHINFKDGSNPYIFISRDGREIVKEFNKWKRAGIFPENYFAIYVGGLTIQHDHAGVWFIRHDNKAKIYKHLGNAINGALKISQEAKQWDI